MMVGWRILLVDWFSEWYWHRVKLMGSIRWAVLKWNECKYLEGYWP